MASHKTESSPRVSIITAFFASTARLMVLSVILRAAMLLYGLYQDSISAVKYTDIDYFVFTDAARYVSQGQSPYERATYRYTPLLAWLLYPTSWSIGPTFWFSSGKILFATADIIAGWFLLKILTKMELEPTRARKFAAIWLLNPMVATISTRGSSEGLLGALTAALLWAVLERRVIISGVILGLGVHFKIYPFIYATSVIWWMDDIRMGKPVPNLKMDMKASIIHFFSTERIKLGLVAFMVFMGLNTVMYITYGYPFLLHTYLHHFTRLDHRHNFSPYNLLLYYVSADPSFAPFGIKVQSVAFFPQLLLSAILIPLICAKTDLPTTMMAQTFAFVTFNKVCTSQYFIWYLIFLPLYLPKSSLLQKPRLGIAALVLWVMTQGVWLHQAYRLEFIGENTFFEMWLASQAFFVVNCWILGIMIEDVKTPIS